MRPPRTIPYLLPAVLAVLCGAAVHAQYPVATADLTLYDAARSDRAVPLDLYYPATAAGADQPVAEPPAGGFAAVAFGHGYQMTAGVYAWIGQRLAAAGCVVAVLRTAGELFPDHAAFGLDLAFAARSLRDAGDDPASPFFGRMGPRTLAMGHSMGGGASILAAAGDPSLTAVANFAAAETNPSAIAACASIDRPALLFAGTNDCVTPPADHQVPMHAALSGWRTLVTVTGASHCQFNAYSFLCAFGEFCSADISRQAQQDLVWLLLEPWVRAVLFLDTAAGRQFQSLLAGQDGFTFEQAGGAAAVGLDVPASRCGLEVYPNPFNPRASIAYELPDRGRVTLTVHDLAGRVIRTIVDGTRAAGAHSAAWDGRTASGGMAASGLYVVRLRTTSAVVARTVSLVR
ncbi:MAG: T9SS type A sorting domain-containing protein [Krumholzibacteria bacterium]|nr:T9SS type A sorting domain-containing protein [Candidatus Krumholzibacteria bacterium]